MADKNVAAPDNQPLMSCNISFLDTCPAFTAALLGFLDQFVSCRGWKF